MKLCTSGMDIRSMDQELAVGRVKFKNHLECIE